MNAWEWIGQQTLNEILNFVGVGGVGAIVAYLRSMLKAAESLQTAVLSASASVTALDGRVSNLEGSVNSLENTDRMILELLRKELPS